MCIKHTHIAWWAGHTDYVNYETGGAFDVAHAYTLNLANLAMSGVIASMCTMNKLVYPLKLVCAKSISLVCVIGKVELI